MRFLTLALSLSYIVLLSGCATTAQRDPAYAPARPALPPPPSASNGAIYQAGYERPLFEDQRARHVGDILTINLVEKTAAQKQAATNTTKENTVDIDNPTLFGAAPQFGVPGIVPLDRNTNNNLSFNTNSTQEFAGKGDSSQSNSLSGSITVSVVEVLSNGYLVVRGEKFMTLNQGDEYIRLSGIVRPNDIRADNSVPSTQVADAQITYSGGGQVADANAAGWLARFFLSALWPF
ncbi:MAG: flagellar basal body L-ring protein FlgH [Pseudomonadota bacterium]